MSELLRRPSQVARLAKASHVAVVVAAAMDKGDDVIGYCAGGGGSPYTWARLRAASCVHPQLAVREGAGSRCQRPKEASPYVGGLGVPSSNLGAPTKTSNEFNATEIRPWKLFFVWSHRGANWRGLPPPMAWLSCSGSRMPVARHLPGVGTLVGRHPVERSDGTVRGRLNKSDL
jgi:hypothetical protein